MGILSKIGIEVAPKQPVSQVVPEVPTVGVQTAMPPVPDAFQNAFKDVPANTLDPTAVVTPMPDAVKAAIPESTPPGTLDPTVPKPYTPEAPISPTVPEPASFLDPASKQPTNTMPTSEHMSRPLDTLTPPPAPTIIPEEPRISSTVDQAPQNTISVSQPEPEIVSTPTIPDPIPPQEPVVTTVTSPEPVSTVSEEAPAATSSENKGTNDMSQDKEQVKKPINFLERYLLKHHLKNYVKENGEIDEEALGHDAQNPDKLQEIDPRVATLAGALKDRGLSLDDPLIAAGVEEVYMEDQKKEKA